MAKPDRIVTIREARRGQPGRVLFATSDPTVIRAVERAMARRLTAEPIDEPTPPERTVDRP